MLLRSAFDGFPSPALGQKLVTSVDKKLVLGVNGLGGAMLSIHEHATVEDASGELLGFILHPSNWVFLERLHEAPLSRPGENPDYQRRVGKLRICASVDVAPSLDVFLRVAFQAPGLTLLKAADCLDQFLRNRLPLLPNSEWQVHVDKRRWIHFIHRYSPTPLRA